MFFSKCALLPSTTSRRRWPCCDYWGGSISAVYIVFLDLPVGPKHGGGIIPEKWFGFICNLMQKMISPDILVQDIKCQMSVIDTSLQRSNHLNY